MRFVFAIPGVLLLLVSLGTCAMAASPASQEIGALVGLIAVVLLGVASILEALERIAARLQDAPRNQNNKTTG